jgi:transposase
MKYSGIDLHSNNSVVVVIDEEDRVVAQKRLPNDLSKIVAMLMPWRDDLVGVVVESTFNWYWLVDGLQAAGFKVQLANTVAIKKYEGLKHSGDQADARYLAHLLRLGILPTGAILPAEQRAVRDLARKRMQLVRSRTTHVLAVENITARQHGARISSNQVKRLSAEAIDQMPLPQDVALAIKANVAVIATLGAQIDLLEKRLQETIAERPEYALLTSVPGIGRVLATTILLETGPIERFAAAGNFASYARCVDSVRISNGKKKGGRQHQERQQIPGLGFRRGGPLRTALLRRSKTVLRTEEGEDEQRGGDQGAGAQAGAGMLPYSEGAQTV